MSLNDSGMADVQKGLMRAASLVVEACGEAERMVGNLNEREQQARAAGRYDAALAGELGDESGRCAQMLQGTIESGRELLRQLEENGSGTDVDVWKVRLDQIQVRLLELYMQLAALAARHHMNRIQLLLAARGITID